MESMLPNTYRRYVSFDTEAMPRKLLGVTTTETAPTRRSNAERSEATIKELVAVARGLFAERGYGATSIEDVVRAAGVTRGALYHHFAGKEEVFRAVFEELQRELAKQIRAAAAGKRDPWRRMEAGCMAFLDAVRDPGVQQIALIDAPAVLGWDGLREIEHRHTLSMWRDALQSAMDEGKLRRRPVEPLAHLLFGALCEAAMMAARSPESDRAMDDVRREVRSLLKAVATR
jgi:AcrR family transcriptional regulator